MQNYTLRNTEQPKPEHLKVDMRCQICDHHWSVEFFGVLFDIGRIIEGCPDCGKVTHEGGRPSLQPLRFHIVENPYAVVGKLN